jgi:hypothetical protein
MKDEVHLKCTAVRELQELPVCWAQVALLRWVSRAVNSGKCPGCLEAAVRLATAGMTDKGSEAREAGSAILSALLQVWPWLMRFHRCFPLLS